MDYICQADKNWLSPFNPDMACEADGLDITVQCKGGFLSDTCDVSGSDKDLFTESSAVEFANSLAVKNKWDHVIADLVPSGNHIESLEVGPYHWFGDLTSVDGIKHLSGQLYQDLIAGAPYECEAALPGVPKEKLAICTSEARPKTAVLCKDTSSSGQNYMCRASNEYTYANWPGSPDRDNISKALRKSVNAPDAKVGFAHQIQVIVIPLPSDEPPKADPSRHDA